MGSRMKEDEKNERSIRALLKQTENRRCINCGSLGPQYVCTTFSIFVCTNCSGLHREFTHRIKSVSMAKFTAEEVKSLQAGGNERGREIFLKDFDLQRNSLPDSSNPEKLRDFIKAVYVDRRYTGDRALPPKGRPGDREDSYGRSEPRPDPRSSPRDYRAGNDTRSPSYEDRYDDRRGVERRRSDTDRGRYDDRRYEDRVVRFEEKKSPGRLDPDPRARYNRGQYDDRQHDDRSRYDERDRDRRNSYDDRFANESRHDRRRSADDRNFKDFDGDSPPVRPVSEILGDNIPTLRVEEYRNTNGRDSRDARDEDDRSSLGSPASSDPRREMRIPRLGSFGSANGSSNSLNSAAIKRASSGSLIDFNADPEPAAPAPAAPPAAADPFGVSSAAAAPQPQPAAVSSSSTGWAVFDLAPTGTTPAPAEAPPAGYPDVFGASANGGQWAASGWPPSQPPALAAAAPAVDNWASLMGPSVQPQAPAAAPQPWNSFSPVNKAPVAQHQPQSQPQQGLPPVQQQVQPQVQSGLNQEQPNTSAGFSAAPNVPRELPKELFASPFPSAGGYGMGQQIPGYPPPALPYNPMVSMPMYAQQPRSRNPFDLPAEAAPSMGGGAFPGMGSLQAALPTGPFSMPGSAPPTMSNQWSMGPQHASYPQGGAAGGNAFAQLSSNFGAQSGMPAHSVGPTLGLSNSGNYNNMPLFGAGQSFMGAGMSDFTTQNSVRPVGGNPFG
ncbi:hypothetical protein Mapa_014027 [Marchantia paleacea]|nr:hypothetical protein Mapa_014027 [Marchantia paleacea]